MHLRPASPPNPVIPSLPAQAGEARYSSPSRALCARNPSSSLVRWGSLLLLLVLGASDARAEYVVLRSGLRLNVTGYQLVGDKYRLQLSGGWVEVPAQEVVAIEPEEVFTPIPAPPPGSVPEAQAPDSPYRDLVAAAASHYSVDAELITSVMAVESNFNPKAISPKNARGLMQLLPETAERLGVRDIFDPKENIEAGTRYLKELLQKYNNDLVLTLAAYNAGPDRVQQYGTVPPYAETISYVRRVKSSYEKSKSSAPGKPAISSGATASPGTTAPASGATRATSSRTTPAPSAGATAPSSGASASPE